jgi:hypothetical protein
MLSLAHSMCLDIRVDITPAVIPAHGQWLRGEVPGYSTSLGEAHSAFSGTTEQRTFLRVLSVRLL